MDLKSQDTYFYILQTALSEGRALPRDRTSVLSGLLYALAAEMARVDVRAAQLLDEADPRTTAEMLADWEMFAGLPSPCMRGVAQTVDERRAALIDRLTDVGGQTAADYVALAARLGAAATVRTFRPFTVDTPVDYPLFGNRIRFYWVLTIAGDGPNRLLECVVRHRAQSHTVPVFIYTG
jgi:uncharacterized protein YmfQ (DUF2313 family)